jgi:hypothetical protein
MGMRGKDGSWSYRFARSIFPTLLLSFLNPLPALAAGGLNKNYNIELAPLVARDLPFDLWGTPGALTVAGIRTSGKFSDWDGAGEASVFYQGAGADKAYTMEVAYRHEVYGDVINGYFSLGYHFSKFSLTTDRDANGNCVLTNCGNDSGIHSGLTYGGGILIPLTDNNPLKMGVRYYQSPQTWVLLELSYGVRF